MHYYSFHPAKFNYETKHLTRLEKAIYRELIDEYMTSEAALVADVDKLAWKLSCRSDDDKNALMLILENFFVVKKDKKGNHHYHHLRLDAEIRAYRWNKGGTPQGTDKNANGTPQGTDKNANGTPQGTDKNANGTPKATDNHRKERYKLQRQNMIQALLDKGIDVDKSTSMADLRHLFATHCPNETLEQGTPQGTDRNASGTDGNAGNAPIFDVKQEPVTSNHNQDKYIYAHEQNFDDKPKTNIVNAEVIRQGHIQSLADWQPPSLDEMLNLLRFAGVAITLSQNQYNTEISDFKAYYEQQAMIGKPLATDNIRQSKLRQWLSNNAKKYQPDSPKDTAPLGNADNTEYKKPNDWQNKVYLNGIYVEPLAGMDKTQTLNHIKNNRWAGETVDETYHRLVQEQVA